MPFPNISITYVSRFSSSSDVNAICVFFLKLEGTIYDAKANCYIANQNIIVKTGFDYQSKKLISMEETLIQAA